VITSKGSHEISVGALLSMPLLSAPPRTPTPTSTPMATAGAAGPSKAGLFADTESSDPHDRPLWIDIDGGDDEALQCLGKTAGLHPLTIEDMQHDDSREKIEEFENGYVFIVIREAAYAPGTNWLIQTNLCIVAFPDLVLTVHRHPVVATRVAASRLAGEWANRRARRLHPPTPAYVVMSLVDAVVDNTVLLVDQIAAESEAISQLVLVFSAAEQDDVLGRIGAVRHRLAELDSSLSPKRAIVKMLVKDAATMLTGGAGIRVFLRDINDHCVRMREKLELADARIDAVCETYLAKVSIAVGQASNNMNDIMRRFAAVATLFLPLSFVTSLWGVNIHVPGGGVPSLLPFANLCIALGIFTVAFLLWFRMRNWL